MKATDLLKKHILLVLLYTMALIDVCYTQPLIVRCLLLVLMLAITLSDDFVFSLPLILMLNDGLGTAFGSYISFYWVAIVLILVKTFLKNDFHISHKTAIFIAVALLYCIFIFFVQYDMSIRSPLSTFAYFLIVAYIIEQIEQGRVSLKSVMLAFGCAVTVAAIQMAFFGGVDYTTYSYPNDDDGWTKTTRYGLLGTGAGDPNYSGLTLLFGLVCLWSSNIKRLLKALLSFLFVYCVVKTVSISTLLIFLLLVLFGLIIQKGLNKKTKMLVGILIGIVLVYVLIVLFPIGDISEQISLYYYRLQSKLNFLSTGNIAELTTGRSSEALESIKYAFDRNPVQFIFGFDSVPLPGINLPHNTYVDVLVHFGFVGALIYIGVIIKKFVSSIQKRYRNHDNNDNLVLSLKFLFITFSFTLSIYTGVDVALLSWILLIM